MALSSQATTILSQYQTFAVTTNATLSDNYKTFLANANNTNGNATLTTLSNTINNWVSNTVVPQVSGFGAGLNAIAATLSGDDLVQFNQQRALIQSQIDGTVTSANSLVNRIKQQTASKPTSTPSYTKPNKASEDDASKHVQQTANVSSVTTNPGRTYNPLSKYSSSTYIISLYMVSPDQAANYSNTGSWDYNNLLLLVQSGGINNGIGSKRAPYFDRDIYIDNLEIVTVVNPKELGYASTSYDIKFQIYEPYGIQFTNNLINAAILVQQNSSIQKQLDQPVTALSMQYLLVVRFYGYDDKGIPVTSDNSTYERAFPITFTGMSFKLDNKMAIYDIKANLINMQIGYDKLRGYMPDSTTISGDTVQSALDALADSLNKKQEAISSPTDATKKQSYPDVYKFMFASNTDIGNSVIVDKSHFVASSTPMPDVLNTLNINVRLSESGKADVVQKQKKEFSFPSMLPMASAVDQIITQSDFLIKALKVVDVETTQKESDAKPDYVTNAKPDPLVWYSMTPKIRVLQSDPKRNDFAYEITYYITEYKVPYVRSTGVTSTSSYEGPFKIYDYWYTGKNTEVLEYSQNFNLLYFVTGAASSAAADANQSDPTRTKQMTSSGASSTGMLSGSKEVMNTVRTALYSPGDTATATIKIIGDPDFLITAAGVPAAFMDQAKNDYSLDPSSGQAYIEIGIKQATDYNNSTGMLNYINQGTGQIDPNNNVNFWDYTDDIKKRTDRVIYMVILLKSHFSKGVFTQELKTILPPFTANTDTSTTTDQRNTDPPAPSTNYGGGRGSRGGATAEELKNAKSINPPIIQITKTWNTPNPDDDNTVFFTQPNKQKSLVQLPGGINLNRGK